jgi:phage head maturation protease
VVPKKLFSTTFNFSVIDKPLLTEAMCAYVKKKTKKNKKKKTKKKKQQQQQKKNTKQNKSKT